MIGTTVKKEITATAAHVVIRVVRPFISEKEHDDFRVEVNAKVFKSELATLKVGETVAIKGRCELNPENNVVIVTERLQIF